jgi:hypothetical protein
LKLIPPTLKVLILLIFPTKKHSLIFIALPAATPSKRAVNFPGIFFSECRKRSHSKYINKLIQQLEEKKEGLESRTGGLKKRNIKTEAKHVEKLMKVQCNTRWNDRDNEAFIVPSQWLNYWKDSKKNKTNPGAISFKEIMLNSDKYYHSLKKESQFDYILKETMEEEKDYYIAPKELWEFLHEVHGGAEAVRYRLNSCITQRKLDIRFSKV